MSAHPPAMVALTEPIAETHDVEADETSHVYGAEDSFSHNYRFLLKRAGFEVIHARETQAGGFRWTQALAATPS